MLLHLMKITLAFFKLRRSYLNPISDWAILLYQTCTFLFFSPFGILCHSASVCSGSSSAGAMSSLLSQNKDEPLIRKSLSDSFPASSAANTRSLRHERLSRLESSSSSDVSNDTSTNHAESYFLRRENRLSAKKKAEEEKLNSDYKKMYEKALATNQRLKSRLETSKQDLAMVQDQLQGTQVYTFSLFWA
ncbi:protein phosphatase 1 regulatory subunit 12A [Fundulus heteroclitus]|uniref:protein phosphatase 1 regulatory subunit 12A n=1 Tax=Fundulus heteroclitus TaxID=8078 RepID=UPI00165A6DB1|nr:protein phosphatase 1 regulatory subunit 12A [Fundulus heteroclitus]